MSSTQYLEPDFLRFGNGLSTQRARGAPYLRQLFLPFPVPSSEGRSEASNEDNRKATRGYKRENIMKVWRAGETPYTPTEDLHPSPAALAAATRITEDMFKDVYRLALFLDDIAEEAREHERQRILSMSFADCFRLLWTRRQIRRK